MFRLEKTFRFEASHRLPSHDGKCARLHGHSWVGTLIVEGKQLQERGPKSGMLVDFGHLSGIVEELRENFLDHHHLNDTLGLENPTSEEIARWIFNRLSSLLPMLIAVRIAETCTSSAEYQV